jgi:SAM-dependent methyltransferase
VTEQHRPYALEVMIGAWRAQAVYVAAKLGIADLLVDGGRPIGDLARELDVDEPALFRVLRALTSIGIFRIDENSVVESTPSAEPLRTDHPNSVKHFAVMINEEVYEAFGGLLGQVRSGKPAFYERFGMPIFHYYDAHPEVAAVFHRGMNNWSDWDTPAIVEGYDFSRASRVVDVGGGNGALLSALLARYPTLSGVLFERPTAIAAAAAGEGGPLPRCELVAGDFLSDDIPRGADLYVIKHVIDGWPDDGAARILRRIRDAMTDDTRLLVADCVIEPGNDPSFVKWLDLLVLTTTEGRMRQVDEYPPVFSEAKLRLERVIPVSDTMTLLECTRA